MPKQLSKPCDNCPFRRDGIKLRRERAEELADGLRADGHFYCHKTVDYNDDDDGDGCSTKDSGLCVGALIAEIRDFGHMDQMGRIMGRVGALDVEGIYQQAEAGEDAVVSDLDEFIDIHDE